MELQDSTDEIPTHGTDMEQIPTLGTVQKLTQRTTLI